MKKISKEKIIKEIFQKRKSEKKFENVIKNFKDFNPQDNNFLVQDYFGANYGKVKARKKLFADNLIIEDKDFKGLYVFLHNNKPFYVGISKAVIERIRQHVKGSSLASSTLAYKIGKNIKKSKVTRKEFFQSNKKNIDFIKKFLLEQRVAFIKIDDDDELALYEIYCAMKYKTSLNTFETH